MSRVYACCVFYPFFLTGFVTSCVTKTTRLSPVGDEDMCAVAGAPFFGRIPLFGPAGKNYKVEKQ